MVDFGGGGGLVKSSSHGTDRGVRFFPVSITNIYRAKPGPFFIRLGNSELMADTEFSNPVG